MHYLGISSLEDFLWHKVFKIEQEGVDKVIKIVLPRVSYFELLNQALDNQDQSYHGDTAEIDSIMEPYTVRVISGDLKLNDVLIEYREDIEKPVFVTKESLPSLL